MKGLIKQLFRKKINEGKHKKLYINKWSLIIDRTS